MLCCAFVIQAIRPSPTYGVVYSQFPVVDEPVLDPLDLYKHEYNEEITPKTPVAILQLDSFVFGHLNSFTKEFYKADNKFRVDHIDGAPRINKFFETYDKWQNFVSKGKSSSNKTLILYPVSEIPMPIVIKALHYLKQSKRFEHVILATDLI